MPSDAMSDINEEAGTLVGDNVSEITVVDSTSPEGDQQALEDHEVIELQAFIERKEWIEEKIKFLEKMPAVEVFAGLDAIRASAEVAELPSRAVLQQWLVEHDAIEKEADIFDSGELKKLKRRAKDATKRNLSPKDTDLIELTLSTIYDVDKLMHLLRDRSENLDLLGIRLTWEESRQDAWVDIRNVLGVVRTFVESRARWSPSTYETATTSEDTPLPSRRGSVASLASVASDSSVMSLRFSRSARFRLAEQLSRDATQFAGKVTNLRHGKISLAGKALDRLIDRRQVPDEILDEQDRLEEKGINEAEHLGKFLMAMVLQWKKADEIYVETTKDETSAQNLLEELDLAKLQHPNLKQSAIFNSRVEKLYRRLATRGYPTAPGSALPCPLHPLFPDQKTWNEALAQTLSRQIQIASDLVKKADSLAKEYSLICQAVQRVENIVQSATELASIFSSIMHRLENGVPVNDGDGSPPSLASEECLQPTKHSAFLALLPSIQLELDQASRRANELLLSSALALLQLDYPGVDPQFRTNSALELERLKAARDRSKRVNEAVIERVQRLKDSRKIWGAMGDVRKHLEELQHGVADTMKHSRWRKQHNFGVPLTPESPNSALTPIVSYAEFAQRLSVIQNQYAQEIIPPLNALSQTLETPLEGWMRRQAGDMEVLVKTVEQMVRLLESVQTQASAMKAILNECNNFQLCIEELKLSLDGKMQSILAEDLPDSELDKIEVEAGSNLHTVRHDVQSFIDGLFQRVPLIDPTSSSTLASHTAGQSSANIHGSILPFDIRGPDSGVRADCNAYVMRLQGDTKSLEQKTEQLRLTRLAKSVDVGLTSTSEAVDSLKLDLTSYKARLADLTSHASVSEALNSLNDELQQYRQRFDSISSSFPPIREILRYMDISAACHVPDFYDAMYLTRSRAIDAAEMGFVILTEDAASFQKQVSDAIQAEILRLELEQMERARAEQERLEQERLVEERRLQVQKERTLAEEAERARQDRERMEAEERRKLEEERRQLQVERERIAAEEAENQRLEQERLVAIAKLRFEEARLVEQRRLQSEKERLAAEEAEKAREERERLAQAEKERLAAEHIEEQNRLQVERDLIAAEKAKLEREQSDFAAKLRAEEERLRQAQAEVEAAAKDREDAIQRAVDKGKARQVDNEDVFGPLVPFHPQTSRPGKVDQLQAHILYLRKRLRSLSINNILRPTSSAQLPSLECAQNICAELDAIRQEVDQLPESAANPSIVTELRSLRIEVQASVTQVERILALGCLSQCVHECDAALSDLLEHIDSYPSLPLGTLTSSYSPPSHQPPEEQLSGRLDYTKARIDVMAVAAAVVSDDPRAGVERGRIMQTWSELEEMGRDRIIGRKSRPASVISSTSHTSSGRNSNASASTSSRLHTRKTSGYSALSVGAAAPPKGKFLVPTNPAARRIVSGSTTDTHSRASSRLSVSSSRSVSSPMSSLYSSTFASRQRTASLSASASTSTPMRRTSNPLRTRPQTGQSARVGSPALSDASTFSHPVKPARSSATVSSTWSRAPRLSLPRAETPHKKKVAQRKPYVPDPKNKLDVAVGDVVNNLPVSINIEGVTETWRDQSGKYWIGDQDPKLCFCRILRSQTVMVRVGGGWTELSKFIRDHFAESFRLLPDSPPRHGSREEKWISSATLLEAPESGEKPPEPPHTPEPKFPFIPTFSVSTPGGRSPRSVTSSPSTKGSPLTPLQFIRRADPDAPLLRPSTPTKTLRGKRSVPHTPMRSGVWRP